MMTMADVPAMVDGTKKGGATRVWTSSIFERTTEAAGSDAAIRVTVRAVSCART